MSKTIKKATRPDGIQHRSLSGKIERVRMDGDEDTVHRYEFKASSDAAVEMWRGYFEVLGHDPNHIRLDWFESGNAPALSMHNRHQQVGIIEGARVEDGHIIVTVRVSQNQEDLIRDIEDGIIKNVSVGYRIHDEELTSRDMDDNGNITRTTWTVTDWEPTEVSFVSIPADRTVGLGRSDEQTQVLESRVKFLEEKGNPESNKEPQRDSTDNNMGNTASAPEKKPNVTVGNERQQQQDAVTAERQRIANIHQLVGSSRDNGLGDHSETAQKFIEDGRSVSDFQSHVLSNIEKTTPMTQRDAGASDQEAKRYDLSKVMSGLRNGDMRGCEYELEMSDALKERAGKENDRIAIPLDVIMRGYLPKDGRQRDLLSVGLTGAGNSNTVSNIVDNELLEAMFIDSLREESPLLGMGVTMLPGLTGDVTIPKELVNPDFYWVNEDQEPTEGNYSLGQIELNFKTLAARIPFTRKAMKQSTPNLEGLLTRSLRIGQSIALEKALINGTGGASQPQGILNAAGIGAVSAATLTHSKLLELEETLGNANADTAGAQILTNVRGKRRLLETEKTANSGMFLAARSGGQLTTDIGNVVVSNNVPNNLGAGTDRSALIYGNFRSLMVGMWGNMEIGRDTSTKAATGGVVLRVFSDVDAKVSRAQEFAAITDLQ